MSDNYVKFSLSVKIEGGDGSFAAHREFNREQWDKHMQGLVGIPFEDIIGDIGLDVARKLVEFSGRMSDDPVAALKRED